MEIFYEYFTAKKVRRTYQMSCGPTYYYDIQIKIIQPIFCVRSKAPFLLV